MLPLDIENVKAQILENKGKNMSIRHKRDKSNVSSGTYKFDKFSEAMQSVHDQLSYGSASANQHQQEQYAPVNVLNNWAASR